MIKGRVLPRNGVVTVGAGCNRKNRRCGGMLRICCLLPSCKVAPGMSAIGGRNLQIEVVADMAARARNIRVPVGEREADGGSRVVYGSSEPTVERVAILACLRELAADVIRHVPANRLCAVPIGLMTRDASRRQALELSNRSALMAILALQSGVGSQQREAVLMILHRLHCDVPALHRMTLSAIRAHFPLMHVRVAVLAIFGHISENWFYVALRALHFFMHAAQWIFRFIVVEFRNRFDGAPSGSRMAVFARDRERAMRTSGGLPLRCRHRTIGWLQCKEQEPAENLK